MPGAGFAVTKRARRASHFIGGRLTSVEKRDANRGNRRHLKLDLRVHGEDAQLTPKLWTDWDVC
jgi:hypothetical protein